MKKKIFGFLGTIAIVGGIVLGSATLNEAEAMGPFKPVVIKLDATYHGGGNFDCTDPGQCTCLAA